MSAGELLARALARRDLSEVEARDKLARAGLDPATIDEAVARARAAGWLDDAKLAAHVVEREMERQPPPAAEGVLEKLTARGIDAEVARAAVKAGVDREAVGERAQAWLRAEARRGVPVRRAAGKLARGGHAPELIEGWIEGEGLVGGDGET